MQRKNQYSTLWQPRDWDFSPRWWPTLLFVLPIPLFVGLGWWQLERAEQKQEQLRETSMRLGMPLMDLTGEAIAAQGLRQRRVRARGVFEADGQILIENRRRGGRSGFHVITPLRIAGSKTRVLVNRGWIPALADGSPAAAPVPEGLMSVSGQSHEPQPPALNLHGRDDAAKRWGKRWPYLTLDLYVAAFGSPVLPVVILQDAQDPGGFIRVWPQEQPKAGMHIGYAIQWFAFALIALLLWLRLSIVRRSPAGTST